MIRDTQQVLAPFRFLLRDNASFDSYLGADNAIGNAQYPSPQSGFIAGSILGSPIVTPFTNQAPVISGVPTSATLVVYGNPSSIWIGPPLAMAPALTLADADDTLVAGATIRITGGYDTGADILKATTTGTAISAAWDNATGTLTLSGTDTIADYQTVMRNVTFWTTDTQPDTYNSLNVRNVQWQVDDGHASNDLSNTALTTVSLALTTDPIPYSLLAAYDTTFFDATTVLLPGFTNTNFPASVVPIDVNGDGHVDFVVPFEDGDDPNIAVPLRIYINDGSNNFSDQTATYFPGGAPHTTANKFIVADFNGDGRPDVYFLDQGDDLNNDTSGAYSLLLMSSGAHGFVDATANVIADIRGDKYNAATGDVNGDGSLDILNLYTESKDPVSLQLRINDGHGVFTVDNSRLPSAHTKESPNFNGLFFQSAAFLDANGDGHPDLLLGATDSSYGRIVDQPSLLLFNDGTGHFVERSNSNAFYMQQPASAGGAIIDSLNIADLNGDGTQDVVALEITRGTFIGSYRILLNDGQGNFTDATNQLFLGSSIVPANPIDTQLVDINGDGFIDIVGLAGDQKDIYLNDGTGHFIAITPGFVPSTAYPNYNNAAGLAGPVVGDFTGDGRFDLVGLSQGFPVGSHDPQPSSGFIEMLSGQALPANQTGDGNANTLLGDANNNTLSGLGGDDVIFGAAGNDMLIGGAGNDYLNGGVGIDTAAFSGNHSAYLLTYLPATHSFTVADQSGGAPDGTDTLTAVENVQFADTTLSLDNAAGAVTQTVTNGDGTKTATITDFAGTPPWATQVLQFDTQGSPTSQTVNNDNGTHWVNSYDPANAASWLWKTDSFDGLGRQTTQTGTNDDGTHWLTLYDAANQYSWSNATLTFDANWNQTSLTGTNDDSSHTITMAKIAAAFDTALWFTTPYDPNFNATPASTVLTGGSEADTLFGHAGNDTLDGVGGNDTLNGGAGNDALTGGTGDDRFVFHFGDGLDTITDFTPGNTSNDLIDLHGYGVTTFTALQALMTQSGADVVIAFDAQNHITLQHVTLAQLNAGDFLFS